MARRRATPLVRVGDPVPDGARVAAPGWMDGFRRYVEHRGAGVSGGVPVSLWSQWHRDRDAWCIEHGCTRPGTKTCVEVYGKPCNASRATPQLGAR